MRLHLYQDSGSYTDFVPDSLSPVELGEYLKYLTDHDLWLDDQQGKL